MSGETSKSKSKLGRKKAHCKQTPRNTARFETRLLKRQDKLINLILERRRIQLRMFHENIQPVPGWIPDLTAVRRYQARMQESDDEDENGD